MFGEKIKKCLLLPLNKNLPEFLFCVAMLFYPVFLDNMLYFRDAGILGILSRTLGVISLSCIIAYLLCLTVSFCCLFNLKFAQVALIILLVGTTSISLIETILIRLFNSRYAAFVFQLIQFTNKSETSEFFHTYITSRDLWLIIGVYVITAILFLLVFKSVLRSHYGKTLKIICVSIISILAIAGFAPYLKDLRRKDSFSLLIKASKDFSKLQNETALCRAHAADFTIDTCQFQSSNIIVIIGESYNKYHSSLYGYHLNTCPKLSAFDNLFVFNDVIAPINSTHIQFHNMFSLASVDDSIEWNLTALLPAIMKKAGFNVCFYSNQYPQRSIVTDAWEYQGMFMDDSYIDSLCFNVRNHELYSFDGELVCACEKEYRDLNAEHNFVIYHLMGQHVDPAKRFPNTYSIYSIADEVRPDLSEKQRQQIADYDNATLYNDFVVSSIISNNINDDCIIIYLADHGDEVNDFRAHVGRSMDFAVGPNVMHNQLDIPFLIFASDKYVSNHPQVISNIQGAVNKPYMIDDLPHLILGLAGIGCDKYIPERDLLSPIYDSSRKRCVGRNYEFDYDKICN